MDIVLGKSKWEMWDAPLNIFLERAERDGFKAVEIYIKSLKESSTEILTLMAEHDMTLVAQILTEGKTFQEHVDSFMKQLDPASELSPVFINTHAGRDIFPFEENVIIYRRVIDICSERGLPVYFETHRGRPTYSSIETRKLFEELPDMVITADFSHWTVVHESDLSDQTETISLAIERSRYIHARPGFAEGPQITDPRAPEWSHIMKTFTGWWRRIITHNLETGANQLIITPEFGPPGYMQTLPYTQSPVADAWAMNVVMKDILTRELIKEKKITLNYKSS